MTMQLDITPDHLLITFTGSEVLATVKRQLLLPRDKIQSVRLTARTDAPRGRWRLPGLGALPGLITTGSYWGRASGWTFWRVYRAQRVVVITLSGHRFHHVVLQVDDVEQLDPLLHSLEPGAGSGEAHGKARLAGHLPSRD